MITELTGIRYYSAFGEFAIKFEWVSASIRVAISQLLRENGLHEPLFADTLIVDLGAESLRSMYVSLLAIAFPLEAKEQKIIDNISSRFKKLIEERNVIIHGRWPQGMEPDEILESNIRGIKSKRTKNGVVHNTLEISIERISALSLEANNLSLLFLRATGCLIAGKILSNNFIQGQDGNFRSP